MTTVRQDHLEEAFGILAEHGSVKGLDVFLTRMEMALATDHLSAGQVSYCVRVWNRAQDKLLGIEGGYDGP